MSIVSANQRSNGASEFRYFDTTPSGATSTVVHAVMHEQRIGSALHQAAHNSRGAETGRLDAYPARERSLDIGRAFGLMNRIPLLGRHPLWNLSMLNLSR